MNAFLNARALAAALTVLVVADAAAPAFAGIADYKFEVVDKTTKVSPDTIISVRLVDTKTGKPVPDAVIFAQRLDMAPDGMEKMATKIAALPSTEPGVYRFKANVSMAGGWRLSLGAKVQGQEGTLEQKLVFKADD